MAELDVQFQNSVEVAGVDLRHAYERPLGEGVEGYSDLLVSAGAAATTVDVAAGIGFVRGDGLDDLGLYRCRNDATKNSAAFEAGGLAAPDSTKPRLDQIIARVYDDEVDSEGAHKWRLAVLKGTATTGDTLDKREGAATLPNSAMLLADVLVPAGAPAALKAENIRDRRPFCYPIVPPLLTDLDIVPLVPLVSSMAAPSVELTHADNDLNQVAVACYLPRRIVGATRIRWKYSQGRSLNAMAGNYALAIYDASGRLVVGTGSVAFVGAEKTHQARAETITPTTFDAGIYYVFFGLDSTAGAVQFPGVSASVGNEKVGSPIRNLVLTAGSGGTTAPTTLLSMNDAFALGADGTSGAVPTVSLAVG